MAWEKKKMKIWQMQISGHRELRRRKKKIFCFPSPVVAISLSMAQFVNPSFQIACTKPHLKYLEKHLHGHMPSVVLIASPYFKIILTLFDLSGWLEMCSLASSCR